MPIPIACPNCQTKMNLVDNLAGKRVRCKSCQHVFPVPPSDEPLDAVQAAPKAARLLEVTAAPNKEPLLDVVRPDDDEDAPLRQRTNRSKFWLFLLIGGVAAALLLLCLLPAGLVAALLFMPTKTNTVTTTPITQAGTNPPPIIPQNPAPNPDPNPPPDPGPGPRPRPNPNPNPNPNQPPPEPDLDANAQPGPKVPADPLPTPLQAPANPGATIPLPSATNNTPVRYSLLPSPVVAVLPTKRTDQNWEIWNLQSMKKLGAVGEVTRSPLVSPDGTYVAMNVYDKRDLIRVTGVEIFTVADGHSLRILRSGDTERGVTGFLGGDLFLSVHGQGRIGSVRLWNVKTGESVSSFQVTGSVDAWWWALSPGGRYLALYDTFDAKHVINVYELKTGKLVRTFHPKLPQAQWYNCMGLAFSYDGKGFAALITVQGKTDRLQAWDFETGQRTLDHSFATPLEKTAKVPVGMRETALQWLPDGSGWIAYQSLLIDRQRGNVFWTIPQEDPAGVFWMRRFLDANSVATVAGMKPRRQLEIITLPKDQLDAARKK